MISIFALNKFALATLPLTNTPRETPPTHHYFLCDISGSMSGSLHSIREQLKKQLRTLIKSSDTVSIIAFSGKNECYTLFSHEPLASITDLANISFIIDKTLTPQGLTGFKQPLETVHSLISKRSLPGTSALIFLTDGYDNQWTTPDILSAAKLLASSVDTATVIEYGWYCNHDLLVEISSILGAELVFSKDISSYLDTFAATTLKSSAATPKKLVNLPTTPAIPLGLSFINNTITPIPLLETADGWVAYVPENASELTFVIKNQKPASSPAHPVLTSNIPWQALACFAQTAYTDILWELLHQLSDVRLVNKYTNAFSKEDYISFQQIATAAALNPSMRYIEGFDPNAVPDENAFTVLQMLDLLTSSESNLFYPRHPQFHYQRTTAKTQQAQGTHHLEFVPESTTEAGPGVPLKSLVWNESRPNLSVLVQLKGTVALPQSVVQAHPQLPANFPTYIWRNYTIIRDGIVHTRELPVSLDLHTFTQLQNQKLLPGQSWEQNKIYWLQFPHLPIINRAQVKAQNATSVLTQLLDLEVLKAEQKVFNHYAKLFDPKTSTTFVDNYGQDASDALTELGITSFNGFNPKSSTIKGSDVYMGLEIKSSAKGLSALPKVDDARATLTNIAKAKIGHLAMHPALRQVDRLLNASTPPAAMAAWARAQADATTQTARKLSQQLAQAKLLMVLGHTWFPDFSATPGQAALTVTSSINPQISTLVSVEVSQVEITI